MRVSLKVDYALRAMVQLAALKAEGPTKAEGIAEAQQIPISFLLTILNELKRAHLVTSQRGMEGGYSLSKPAVEITLADVIRAIDGPLANVHDSSLSTLAYPDPAAPLREVWMALRISLRNVLEAVSLSDIADDRLPKQVRAMAKKYRADVRH